MKVNEFVRRLAEGLIATSGCVREAAGVMERALQRAACTE